MFSTLKSTWKCQIRSFCMVSASSQQTVNGNKWNTNHRLLPQYFVTLLRPRCWHCIGTPPHQQEKDSLSQAQCYSWITRTYQQVTIHLHCHDTIELLVLVCKHQVKQVTCKESWSVNKTEQVTSNERLMVCKSLTKLHVVICGLWKI